MLVADYFEDADDRYKVQFVPVRFVLKTDPPPPNSQFTDQSYWLTGMVPIISTPSQWVEHRVELALMDVVDPACQEIADYMEEFCTVHKLKVKPWEELPKPGATTSET